MGEVYLAHDRDLPRFTALKVLNHTVAGDDDAHARFLREADTAARLAHPNIVTVYARGQEHDRLWMAMQYIDGTDVAALLRNGPLHPEHAVHIVRETAKALDFAHHSGVLHRDVKPANVLLANTSPEQVFLADFGIAKALDQTNNLTRTGELYASFQYAAPEQFDGVTRIDHRADVYALGCTLFHMITGVIPFPGTTTGQLIHGHLNLPVPQPSQQNPWLPAGFDTVIARALAKNRDERFSSCGELAAAAHHALAGGSSAAPIADPSPNRRWGKMAAVAAGALVLGGGTAAGGYLAYSQWSTSRVEDAGEAARQAACDFATKVATYDYTDPSTLESNVAEGATGSFKSSWDSSYPALRDNMIRTRGRQHVKSAQCFLKNADPDRAEVAVVLDQVASSEANGQSETSKQISVVLTMEKVGDRWLCSKLDPVK